MKRDLPAPREYWWPPSTTPAVAQLYFLGSPIHFEHARRKFVVAKDHKWPNDGAVLLVAEDEMISKSFQMLVLGAVLVHGASVVPLRAEDGKRPGTTIAFEWRYSCPDGKACSFTCPRSGGANSGGLPDSGGGANGANNVTKLRISLGTIALGGDKPAPAIFYEFSTPRISQANGFALTTGLGTLSCQVQGMNLDYSGPSEKQPSPLPKSPGKEDVPTASITK